MRGEGQGKGISNIEQGMSNVEVRMWAGRTSIFNFLFCPAVNLICYRSICYRSITVAALYVRGDKVNRAGEKRFGYFNVERVARYW